MEGKVKICSLNVRGLRDYKKLKSIFNFLKSQKGDVYLLQETHVDSNKIIEQWNACWGNTTVHSIGTSQSAGVAILFNPSQTIKIIDKKSDEHGRILCVKVEIEDKIMAIGNIYAPNNDDAQFFISTINLMESLEEYDIQVLGGDFNLVMDPTIDRHNSVTNHNLSLSVLNEYMDKTQLCDIWRIQHNDCRRYSWHRGISKSASRIDMLLISDAYADSTIESEISPSIRSDHSLIHITIQTDNFKRGPGF